MNRYIKQWAISNCCEDTITCLFCSKVATVACGIKPAEIISVKIDDYLKCTQIKDHINSRIIWKTNDILKVLLYNQECLTHILENPNASCILGDLGYPIDSGFKTIIDELIHRLRQKKEFPHEIGIFLGYPLKDVCGYMGLNTLTLTKTMGWQMYGDTADSEKIYYQRKYFQQSIEKLLKSAKSA